MTRASESQNGEPVSIVFRRRVRLGQEAAYEAWLAGMQAETRESPGYLGVQVVRPAPGGNEYLSIFRFESVDALTAWERSELRKIWVAKIPAHAVEGEVEIRRLEGMEVWFDAGDGAAPSRAPTKWKMALVLATIVYSLILILGPIVTFVLGEGTPLPIRLAVSVAVEVSLMTWLVMPAVTRALGGWLYR